MTSSRQLHVPLRPVLRAGAPVLRRDAEHLQIGTSPGVVIVDRPGLLSLIRSLDGTRTVPQLVALMRDHPSAPALDVPRAISELAAAGVLGPPREDPPAPRSRLVVTVECDEDVDHLARDIESLLAGQQLFSPPVVAWGADVAELTIMISGGEGRRSRYENACLLGMTHLVVTVDEASVHVGPLVIPGHSPCVACLDLHRIDFDSAWPALIPQLGHPLTHMRPAVVAPLTRRIAAAHIADHVDRFSRGDRDAVVGGRLSVGPTFDRVRRIGLAFHPMCTCNLLIPPR
jgi:bacteriocin biosynthesis cyclodehydratase domain-containing protein